MPKVLRYDCGYGEGMFENEEGDYVAYSDYEKLEKELNELKKELKNHNSSCRLFEITYRSAYAAWDQRVATYRADTQTEAIDKFWANRNKENYEVMYVRQISGD